MAVSLDDNWPKYNPGRREHLHALGVIGVVYAQFARGIDDLLSYHPLVRELPTGLVDLMYFSLPEERRIETIKALFDSYPDKAVGPVIANLLQYFNWAKHARNTLLHAEHYPPLFGGKEDFLYLTKQEGKRSRKTVYVAVSAKYLREIADKIQAGVEHAATIRIWLRVRNVPADKLPLSLRVFAHEALPGKLRMPKRLRISLTPHGDPIPPYLLQSSDPER